ncbi:hypothetical protein DPMN_008844 [Dreissena polymorpha]|uniref:Uncharacterized protein n=1 Tax=Dreissena polymorpha TaxID=45954 RepID=A0A9D4N047_DREPO|nr:hypothetical protein DPMN_008844 [Dreissena polymorpha]
MSNTCPEVQPIKGCIRSKVKDSSKTRQMQQAQSCFSTDRRRDLGYVPEADS